MTQITMIIDTQKLIIYLLYLLSFYINFKITVRVIDNSKVVFTLLLFICNYLSMKSLMCAIVNVIYRY